MLSRTKAVLAGAAVLTLGSTTMAFADGQITGRDIQDGSIWSRDVSQLFSRDIAPQSLRSWDLAKDSVGLSELKDDAEASFAPADHNHDDRYYTKEQSDGKYAQKSDIPGKPGMSHWSVGGEVPAANKPYAQADPTDPTYMPGSLLLKAECQAKDQYAISGGYTAGSYKGGVTTYVNYAIPGEDPYAPGWQVGFTNYTDKPQQVRTWVICAEMSKAEPAPTPPPSSSPTPTPTGSN